MSKQRTRHIIQWRSRCNIVTFNKDTGGSFVSSDTDCPNDMFNHCTTYGGDGWDQPLEELKRLWPADRWIVR